MLWVQGFLGMCGLYVYEGIVGGGFLEGLLLSSSGTLFGYSNIILKCLCITWVKAYLD